MISHQPDEVLAVLWDFREVMRLSERESKVLWGEMNHIPRKETAAKLGISANRVFQHLMHIYDHASYKGLAKARRIMVTIAIEAV